MLSRSEKMWIGLTYWISAASVFGIIEWSTLTVVDMRNDLSKAEKDRAALSQQVKDLGGTPVVGPRGTNGKPGRDGRDGDPGSPGTPGRDGSNGLPGAAGKPGTNGQNGSTGPAGRDGRDGVAGRDGIDGRDGAVGPPGPKGDTGPAGPQCPDGYSPNNVWVGAFDSIICTKNQTLGR